MPTRSYLWLLLALAAVGLTADQVSKYRVFRWLYNDGQTATGAVEAHTRVVRWHHNVAFDLVGGRYDVIPGWFGLIAEYVEEPTPDSGFLGTLQTWSAADRLPHVNHGALFGLGGDHKATANAVFAGISLVAAIGIVIWGSLRSTRSDRWLSAALGLILSGTLGNFYDRVVFGGVRDFLYVYKINWPVFNVADCALVCGAGMLLFHAFFLSPPADAPKPTAPPPAAS